MKYLFLFFSTILLVIVSFSLTIYDVQYTENISGASPYAGQIVTVSGIVTRVFGVNVYIQDDTLPWHGILVYNPPTPVEVGDSISVTGQVVEYNGKTEISNPTVLTVLAKGRMIPGPVKLKTGEAGKEKWEGMFVQLEDCYVSQIVTAREWQIDDGTGPLTVYEDLNYPVTVESLNDTFIFVRGCMDEYNGKFELRPYGNEDVLKTLDGSGVLSVNPKFFNDSSFNHIRVDLIPNVDTVYGTIKYLKVVLNKKVLTDSIKVVCDSSLISFDSTKITFDTTSNKTTININDISFKDTIKIYIKDYYFTNVDTVKMYTGVTQTQLLPVSSFFVMKKIPFADIMNISEVQSTNDGYNSKYVGQVVSVKGIVTGSSSIFSPTATSTGFYIQDQTGGVNIYSSSDPADQKFKEGIEVIVRGTVTEYNGLTEIKYSSPDTDVYIINDTIAIVKPEELLNSQGISENVEGKLLKIRYGKILTYPVDAGTGKNFQVQNGFSVIDVRIGQSTGLYLDNIMSSIMPGNILDVTGIGSQYDNQSPYTSGYQLLVRKRSDINILSLPEDSTFSVSLFPNPFSPDYGQVLRIELKGLNTERFTLKIYDINGKHIKTIAENQPGSNIYQWDGKDKNGARCNIGIFILNVSKIDPNGYVTSITKPIVISTKLK
ncbi:MAG: hypothetical protein ABIN05_06475 [candidate division WOR-3 bacterium]